MAESVISPHQSLSKSLPPGRTIATGLVLIFLMWAFLSRHTLKFYASFLFFFYSFTHSMWISVVMLGIFQTILLIPFRIINITKSKNIKDFETTIAEQQSKTDQSFLIKKKTKTGNKVILYYLIDFFVNLTSYVSIGRLFLTDFYSNRLDPWLLYDFVRYPEYPLQDVWFKIPYIRFDQTRDLGFSAVLWVWGGLLLLLLLGTLIRRFLAKRQVSIKIPIAAFISGSFLMVMIVAYLLIRHFPTSLSIAIFSGDVSRPFPPMNAITALGTFFTILWLDIPTILKKGKLAEAAEIEPKIIQQTQIKLFGETLRSATVVGLGAYYITNKIPCAFELSIFTLEIISWLSPLTLDRLILNTKSTKETT